MVSERKKYYRFLIVSVLLMFVMNLMFNIFILDYFFSIPLKYTKVVEEKAYKNVVFLGDSITEVYDLGLYYADSDYIIINSGYSGNTSRDILNNIYKRALQYKPAKVFLLIGTNDVGFGLKSEETVENIKRIITRLQENENTQVYVESIYPINSDLEKSKAGMRTNDSIKKINEQIRSFCLENNITYIDLYKSLLDENDNLKDDYTKDGLHLSKDGYKIVTDVLKEYMD